MFWQGGFLFYGVVVVTIAAPRDGERFRAGQDHAPRHDALNLSGIARAARLGWTGAERRAYLKRPLVDVALFTVDLAVLAWLHVQMDALMMLNAIA